MYIFIGGSGRLGRHFLAAHPYCVSPTHDELDITDAAAVYTYLASIRPKVVIHAAAVVGKNEAESDRLKAIRVNVDGTVHIAKACGLLGIRLVYISSVSVFDGTKGAYTEEDLPHPVYFYGWTKYAGEQSVRMVANAVIVRTDFFDPDALKYSTVFTDHYCSKMPVGELVAALYKIANSQYTGILHVGKRRDTLFNIIRHYQHDITGITISESGMPDFPRDLSLNVDRFESFLGM